MNNKGFSLIELLIVIVIIGIIAVIAVPSLLESKKAAQAGSALETLRNVASAQVAYSSKSTNKGAYGNLTNLCSQGFLDKRFSANSGVNFAGYTFGCGLDGSAYFTVSASPDDGANPKYMIDQSNTLMNMADGVPVGS